MEFLEEKDVHRKGIIFNKALSCKKECLSKQEINSYLKRALISFKKNIQRIKLSFQFLEEIDVEERERRRRRIQGSTRFGLYFIFGLFSSRMSMYQIPCTRYD